MKTNQRKFLTLSDIRLTFYPKSITYNHSKQGAYRLYLQKNVQVITDISEIIKIRPKNSTYIFSNDQEAKPFRITNQKYCTYQISLYQLQQNEEETFKDSAEFSLQKFICNYFDEFQRLEEQIKEKQKSLIAERWRALSNNFTRKIYTNTVKFKQTDAVFEFVCIPETEYDQIVRQDNIMRQRRKQLEQKLKKPGLFSKSKTLPALKLDKIGSILSKKYHENDTDVSKSEKQVFIDEKTKKQMTESLKKFTLKLPDSHKSLRDTQAASSNQNINGQNEKSKNLDKKNSISKQIKMSDPIQQQSIEQAGTQSGKIPIMEIKDLKSIENPEIYGLSARLGNLSINSVLATTSNKSEKIIQQKSNIKQNVVASIWIVVNVMLIVYLMHPLRKF